MPSLVIIHLRQRSYIRETVIFRTDMFKFWNVLFRETKWFRATNSIWPFLPQSWSLSLMSSESLRATDEVWLKWLRSCQSWWHWKSLDTNDVLSNTGVWHHSEQFHVEKFAGFFCFTHRRKDKISQEVQGRSLGYWRCSSMFIRGLSCWPSIFLYVSLLGCHWNLIRIVQSMKRWRAHVIVGSSSSFTFLVNQTGFKWIFCRIRIIVISVCK